MKNLKYILTAITILALSTAAFIYLNNPQTASATWWNDSWLYRKAIVINADYVAGASSHADFPVMVNFSDADVAAYAQEDGDDFVFLDESGQRLKHEIVRYASSTGSLLAYVRVPSLDPNDDTTLYLYYGNAVAPDQSDAIGTWADKFAAVYHLDDEAGNGQTVYDSTGNCNGIMYDSDGDSDESYTGKVGKGVDFHDDGDADYVGVGACDALDLPGEMSIFAWANFDELSAMNLMLGDSDSGATASQYGIAVDYSAVNEIDSVWGTGVIDTSSSNFSSSDIWYQVGFVRSGSTGDWTSRIYVDGQLDEEAASIASNPGSQNSFSIGRFGALSSYHFNGKLDEVMIYNEAISGDWIETMYNNHNSTSTFFSIQAQETGPGPVGYWSFDEGYGATAHDESGQGNDGTITGAVWKGEEECVSGKCLWFDGIDDQVDIGDIDREVKTISFWVKATSSSASFLALSTANSESATWGPTAIAANADDGSDENGTWYVNGNGSTNYLLSMGQYPGESSNFGVRWDNVSIPSGATIDSAYISLYSTAIYSVGTPSGNIQAWDTADASQFSGGNVPSTVTKTTASVSCTPSSPTATGWKTTPDIGAVVNEIYNSYGLNNEAINFTFVESVGDNNAIDFRDYNHSDSNHATLTINYSTNGTVAGYVSAASGALSSDLASPTVYVNGVAGGEFSANEWQHIVITSDTATSAENLVIGAIGSVYYGGFMDEVKVYPYARTADQIRQDYLAGLAGVSAASGVSASFGASSDKWMSDGLVGYWKFDELATTSGAIDSSGNGNTGTYYGDASTTAGKFGKGFEGDGSGDYVHIGNPAEMEFSDENFSISLWFNADEDNVVRTLISKADDYVNWTALYVNQSDYLQWYCDDNTNNAEITITGDYDGGPWYHVAVVRDSDMYSMYIDGILAGTSLNNGDVSNAADWVIGRRDDGNYGMNGQIDEVRIYNRALSRDEVAALHEWAPGPLAHWKFDEKSGTTTFDSVASSSTAGGNDGIIGGATWAKGKYGGALKFDSATDGVYVDDNEKINNLGVLTISAWLYHDNSNDYYDRIVSKEDDGFSFQLHSNNLRFTASRWDTTGLWTSSYSGYFNRWTHVAVVYDYGSLSNDPVFYIDGVQADSSESIAPSGSLSSETSNLYIGNLYSGSRNIDGFLDDVRIYNYARTQKQILEDMAGGQGQALKHPVLHLSFDEGQGGTAYDSSIHGNDGLLYPGTSGSNTSSSSMWTKGGKAGGAIEFDGTDDYVLIADDASLDADTVVTISAWVKADDLSQPYVPFVSKIQTAGSVINYYLGFTTNKLLITFYNSGWNNHETISTYSTDIWYHVTGVIDGEKDLAKIYVNGELVLNESETASMLTNSGPVYVGVAPGEDEFNGEIDEVKIWNYALSEDEIKTEFNSGQAAVMGAGQSRSNNGTAVTGASRDYCIPGDTSQCDAPILELKMDEKNGGTVYDTSGLGYNGSLGGGTAGYMPSWKGSAYCPYGACLDFDGTDDYVELTSLDLSGTDAVTVSFWFNTSVVTSDNKMLFEYSVNTNGNNAFYINMNEFGLGGCIGIGDRTSTYNNVVTGNTYADGNWHYFTGVIDRGLGNNQSKIYIDGVDDTTAVTASDLSGNFGGPFNSYIISRAGSVEFLDGSIDDFKVYDYARTPAQIAWDYNRGKPIAHWSFDECSGGTIHDNSGNGNHGQLYLGTSGTTATGTCASSSDSFWYNGRSGKYNSSGSFDGESDNISFGDTTFFDDFDAMSGCVWVKNDSVSSYDYLLAKHDGNSGFYFARDNVGSSGRTNIYVVRFYRAGFSSASLDSRSEAAVNGIWTHVCYTFAEDSNNGLHLYINGIEDENSPIDTTGGISIVDVSTDFTIGGYGSYYFDGQIDEVKIWNYALTPLQVKNEFNGGSVRFGN